MNRQPWIGKPLTDILFILAPAFLSLLVVFLLPASYRNSGAMSDTSWLILIVLVDVSHVYSTLYRTYFDPKAFRKKRQLLIGIPLAGFIAGVLVYSLDDLLFWRLLAYIAVFHFVRQQYGFLRIYGRYESGPALYRKIDALAIYTATIYPLAYWHLSGPRQFNWFVNGDFLYLSFPAVLQCLKVLYWAIILLYLIKEIILIFQSKVVNLPKNAVMIGTFLSWYFGIIYFNGDLIFTLLNVIGHGVPYMALVWIHGNKTRQPAAKTNRLLQILYNKRYGIFIFLIIILAFAFLEESLWDVFVWKEHGSVLLAGWLPRFTPSHEILSFLVPALALPQLTHYILDAFIWKIKKDGFKWSGEASANKIEA